MESSEIIDFFKSWEVVTTAITTLLVVFVSLLNRIENFISLFDRFKKRKLDLLLEASNSALLSENFKDHLKEEIESEYFRLCHKVSIPTHKRNLILKTYLEMKKDIPFKEFIVARNNLTTNDNDIGVEISIMDMVHYYYTLTVSFLVFLLSFTILLIGLTSQTLVAFAVFTPLFILGIAVTLLLISTTWNIKYAKKINVKLKERKPTGGPINCL